MASRGAAAGESEQTVNRGGAEAAEPVELQRRELRVEIANFTA
jgi:hypothetical protein